MPGYKTHDIGGIILASVAGGAAIFFDRTIVEAGILAISVIVGSSLLSPDLDTGSRIHKRWGIFSWLWWPYKRLIGHRSWVSHSGPISATIRLLYLLVIFAPLIYLLAQYIDLLQYTTIAGIIWLGLVLADTLHVIMDKVSTKVKKAL